MTALVKVAVEFSKNRVLSDNQLFNHWFNNIDLGYAIPSLFALIAFLIYLIVFHLRKVLRASAVIAAIVAAIVMLAPEAPHSPPPPPPPPPAVCPSSMTFPLQVDGQLMRYNGLDGDNDPLIAPSSEASGGPVCFTWEPPYLTCFSSEFKQTGKKHFFGIASGHGKPFAAWDADRGEKYMWNQDGETFKNQRFGYTVQKG